MKEKIIISVAVNDRELYEWVVKEAKKRNMTVSRFLAYMLRMIKENPKILRTILKEEKGFWEELLEDLWGK